jgi:hypothetical protein
MNDVALYDAGRDSIPIPQNALERLRAKARLMAEVEVWKPVQPGDALEGLIVGSRETSGPFGRQRQMIVQTPEGHLRAVWLNDWLLKELKDQGAERGALVSLTFRGRETSKRGTAFNRMDVVVLPASEMLGSG